VAQPPFEPIDVGLRWQGVDVADCDWDPSRRDTERRLYPIGSDTRTANHLADAFLQWTEPRPQRRPVPSRDRVEIRVSSDGTKQCFERHAISVWNRLYAHWCLRLYRFKRLGRGRKIAGWTLMLAGGAATLAIPGGVFLHLWAASAGMSLITSVGTTAATVSLFAANGAQGVPTQLVPIGPPQKDETFEEYLRPTVDDGTSLPELVYEDGPPRICQANGIDHEPCRPS
jgi:hypothetical protein